MLGTAWETGGGGRGSGEPLGGISPAAGESRAAQKGVRKPPLAAGVCVYVWGGWAGPGSSNGGLAACPGPPPYAPQRGAGLPPELGRPHDAPPNPGGKAATEIQAWLWGLPGDFFFLAMPGIPAPRGWTPGRPLSSQWEGRPVATLLETRTVEALPIRAGDRDA